MNESIFNIPNYYDPSLIDEIIQRQAPSSSSSFTTNDPTLTSFSSTSGSSLFINPPLLLSCNDRPYYSFLGGNDIFNPCDFLSDETNVTTVTSNNLAPTVPEQHLLHQYQDQSNFSELGITGIPLPADQFDIIGISNSNNNSVRSNSVASEIPTIPDEENTHHQLYYDDQNYIVIPTVEKYKEKEPTETGVSQQQQQQQQDHQSDYATTSNVTRRVISQENYSQTSQKEDAYEYEYDEGDDVDTYSHIDDIEDNDDSDDSDFVLHGSSGYLSRGRPSLSATNKNNTSTTVTATATAAKKSSKITTATKKKLSSHRRSKKDDPTLPLPVCTNCKTTTTSLWRRDDHGNPLCNACGLFLKLHGMERPLSLKTDVIKRRNRQSPSVTKKRKRKDGFLSKRVSKNNKRKKQTFTE
ncbi:hypothetical protein INT45_006770 [Circinella minor]|uniref:GATA-type domain-containing protein n=1 Tax=Circinella minor TaxID=1195481 RepID=A0A8H7S948_9FUNG|nr:hypothetical protein INT45_006770 [Circinella minor]